LNENGKAMGMKETLKVRDEEEIDKIHMDENYEVQAWCEMFEVSVMDLKQAVAVVGTSAIKVKHYLDEKLKIRNQNHRGRI
jgi:hypothetical protein